MKIKLNSVLVDNQDKALKFYTKTLGFIQKNDFHVGKARRLTVESPDSAGGPELLLEPTDNPAAKAYQQSLFEQEIPLTGFEVENIMEEYERLKHAGVKFRSHPYSTGNATVATFEDTCGNLIQLYQI